MNSVWLQSKKKKRNTNINCSSLTIQIVNVESQLTKAIKNHGVTPFKGILPQISVFLSYQLSHLTL